MSMNIIVTKYFFIYLDKIDFDYLMENGTKQEYTVPV